ncbi:uncharacterized protein LOC103009854 [Balaenoptera acutorostrata]|uniref:Uncharacterized protein LOC103009854 n=1 Tax=Balaenoptera acutorostrata TaxID=9767 RepID=A0A384AW33_BALAC|nr:uncharacterized protein LOC103009854 [Balaenoptera acutorostrata]
MRPAETLAPKTAGAHALCSERVATPGAFPHPRLLARLQGPAYRRPGVPRKSSFVDKPQFPFPPPPRQSRTTQVFSAPALRGPSALRSPALFRNDHLGLVAVEFEPQRPVAQENIPTLTGHQRFAWTLGKRQWVFCGKQKSECQNCRTAVDGNNHHVATEKYYPEITCTSLTGSAESMEINVSTEGTSMMQVWQDVYTTGGQNQILLTRASGDMGSWNLPSRPELRGPLVPPGPGLGFGGRRGPSRLPGRRSKPLNRARVGKRDCPVGQALRCERGFCGRPNPATRSSGTRGAHGAANSASRESPRAPRSRRTPASPCTVVPTHGPAGVLSKKCRFQAGVGTQTSAPGTGGASPSVGSRFLPRGRLRTPKALRVALGQWSASVPLGPFVWNKKILGVGPT